MHGNVWFVVWFKFVQHYTFSNARVLANVQQTHAQVTCT